MSDIFISYARGDESRIVDFANELERLGWTVWYDRDIRTSAEFDEQIERELDLASCVIVVWSQSSIKSRWVRAEAAAADEQGKLIPVTFDFNVIAPLRFRQLNIAKLSSTRLENSGVQEQSLIAEIALITGKSPLGWEAQSENNERSGCKSGAKMVTPGKWSLTTKFIFAKAYYQFEFFSSGILSGKGKWAISKPIFNGRWQYDSSQKILQIELSGGVIDGSQMMIIQIIQWSNDDTAICEFQGREAILKRQ